VFEALGDALDSPLNRDDKSGRDEHKQYKDHDGGNDHSQCPWSYLMDRKPPVSQK
jgi:hypothetical protein